MKRFFLFAFVLAFISNSSFAQKVRICIDFNNSDSYTDSHGHGEQLTPSGISAADQSAIISQVQGIYEAVVGKGNVEVKNAKDGGCDSSKLVVVSGTPGPGDEYGDANIHDDVCVVYDSIFIKQGFKGDTLRAGIGESVAHEAAHLILGCEGHNSDTNSIFCPGNKISIGHRMADHRGFTSKDSLQFVKVLALSLNTTAPARGTFSVSSPQGTTPTPDEYASDFTVNIAGYLNGQIGYMGVGGNFIGGPGIFDPGSSTMTIVGNQSLNLAVKWGNTVYPANNYGNLYLADPNPSNPGWYREGLINFSTRGKSSYLYMGIAAGSSNNCISQNFSNLIRTLSPLGGNCIGTDELDEFDVILTPEYLIVDDGYASTEDIYWYPPDGLEILDGSLEQEFYNPFTGADVAYYWVLLSDGSCVELKFVTDGYFPFITTTIDEVNATPPNPFVPSFYGSVSLVDGPLTVLGSNSVFRYNASQKAWRQDSTGFGGAYVQSIAGDTSGRIFAATSSGLFMQQNTSLSWTPVSSFTASSPQVVFVDRLQRIYVATYSSVYYSADHGSTWTQNNTGLFNTAGFVSKFGNDKIGNVYAIKTNYTSPSQGYKSAGGTSAWMQFAQSVTAEVADVNQGYNFNRISGDSTSLFLSTTFGLYKSTDMGTTWATHNRSIRTTGYYSIAKNAQNELFLGTDAGLFSGSYQDTGWKKSFPSSRALSMNQRPLYIDQSGNLYTLGIKLSGFSNFGYAIARSTNGGNSWTQDSTGMSAIINPGRYYVDPSGKEFIASTDNNNHAVIYSRSKAGVWAPDQSGFVPRDSGEYVSMLGSDGTNVYLASTFSSKGSPSGIIWKYSNGTWAVDSNGLNNAQVFTFATDNNSTLFAGAADRILMFASNKWTTIPLPNGVPNNIFYISSDASGAIFGTFYSQNSSGNYVGHGVYFTHDKGQRWTRVNLGDTVGFQGLYSYGDTTYVLTPRGVFAYTSNLWATSYIPEGVHSGNKTVTIDAGSVKVGTVASIPIRITNFGNDTLHVSQAVVIGSPVFTLLSGFPNAAAPGQVINTTIQFKPLVVGTVQSTIVVSSNSLTQSDTIIISGEGTLGSSVKNIASSGFALEQNFPNPFTPSTTIPYTTSERSYVTLKVFDALGRELATLANGMQDAGEHKAIFDAGNLSSGIYFYTLQAGIFNETKSMLILK